MEEDLGPILLGSWGHSYLIVRGEILGFMKVHAKAFAKDVFIIKNESLGFEDNTPGGGLESPSCESLEDVSAGPFVAGRSGKFVISAAPTAFEERRARIAIVVVDTTTNQATVFE